MKNKSLLQIIKSNNFALWVAILSVVVQSFHSYTAFYNASSLKGSAWGVAQAILFAIIIDLAILFYTVRNKRTVAGGAAFVMVIINSYYYFQHWGISFEFIFGVFLALIIPISVYFYSEEIKEEGPKEDPEKISLQYRVKEMDSMIRNGREENKRFSDMIDELRKDEKSLFDQVQTWGKYSAKLQKLINRIPIEVLKEVEPSIEITDTLIDYNEHPDHYKDAALYAKGPQRDKLFVNEAAELRPEVSDVEYEEERPADKSLLLDNEVKDKVKKSYTIPSTDRPVTD